MLDGQSSRQSTHDQNSREWGGQIYFLNLMNCFNGKTAPRTRTPQTLQMVPSAMSETWATMSSNIASLMFAWAIICQYSPYEVRSIIEKLPDWGTKDYHYDPAKDKSTPEIKRKADRIMRSQEMPKAVDIQEGVSVLEEEPIGSRV